MLGEWNLATKKQWVGYVLLGLVGTGVGIHVLLHSDVDPDYLIVMLSVNVLVGVGGWVVERLHSSPDEPTPHGGWRWWSGIVGQAGVVAMMAVASAMHLRVGVAGLGLLVLCVLGLFRAVVAWRDHPWDR